MNKIVINKTTYKFEIKLRITFDKLDWISRIREFHFFSLLGFSDFLVNEKLGNIVLPASSKILICRAFDFGFFSFFISLVVLDFVDFFYFGNFD